MRRSGSALGVIVAGVLGVATPAVAQDLDIGDLNFTIDTSGVAVDTVWALDCKGPWVRSIPCLAVVRQPSFAIRTFGAGYPAWGAWTCNLHLVPNCDAAPALTKSFCALRYPPQVTITVGDGGGGGSLDFGDLQPPPCATTAMTAFLGHQAPGAPTVADIDTYLWRGRGGGPFTVRLDRSPFHGSKGERARLRVLGDGGAVIGQTAGALPLRLRGTVPPSGLFEIAVAEPERLGSDSFRGTYDLTVEAAGVDDDRPLEPRRDVEP